VIDGVGLAVGEAEGEADGEGELEGDGFGLGQPFFGHLAAEDDVLELAAKTATGMSIAHVAMKMMRRYLTALRVDPP
jgi:hypothetical protein